MKAIKITGLREPEAGSVYKDRLNYKVNLGNGITRTFSNKAAANAFLSEVSRYLTYKMHECNELYISCFTLYRRAWFYFDHNKNTMQRSLGDLYHRERVCEQSIRNVSDTFTILYKRSNWVNGNHFVFVHFSNILTNLQQICENLQYLYENKSSPAINYELEILRTKIIYCRKTIEQYTVEIENELRESDKTVILKMA